MDVPLRREEIRPVPPLLLVDLLELGHNEVYQNYRHHSHHRRVPLAVPLPADHDRDEEQAHQSDRYRDDPSLQTVLLSISARKNDGLASFGVPAGEGDVVDDVVNDA